jgi:glycosyltransferase involved in cell wall biosynthesis
MASGVPVVASRVGGLAGTVKDGETGYLIPWLCPEPAERIELLLENEPLRQNLGEVRARDGTLSLGERRRCRARPHHSLTPSGISARPEPERRVVWSNCWAQANRLRRRLRR